MAKYLRYICVYTNKKYEVLLDSPPRMLFFRYIQKFNFFQKKINCNGIGKINLIMTDTPVEHLNMERWGDIMNILLFLDKKKCTLSDSFNYYTKVMTDIWVKCKFDLEPLSNTLSFLSDFYLPWEHTINTLYNNSRTFSISLKICVDLTIKLYLVVHKPNETNHLVLLSEINPDIYISETIKHYCNKKYWKTDLKFIIELANHRDYWEYDVESDTVKFIYPRAEENDPHGLYDLGLLYMKGLYVLKDLDMAKYLLELSLARGYSKAKKALKELLP